MVFQRRVQWVGGDMSNKDVTGAAKLSKQEFCEAYMLRLVTICGVPVARHRSQLIPCGYNDGPSFVGQEVLADAKADFGSMMPMIEVKGRAVGNPRWWWLDEVGALGPRKFMMENYTIGCSKMNQATRGGR
ncbi:hypothetical protein J6590_093691 [Homalodisca vitripennis]|nr:hypothetical protein J6590_093691 [Homalodisca vitripennis]